ncbi:MAG TPA: acyl-CoA dehydrogenase family protein [Burkholderiales bacterium]|nr:acyl-CoA dehydrogenase family protein [Burkholderiales bacterium]
MDLSLNDTQQLIQDSARDFVRGACERDVLLKLDRNPTGVMDGIWRQMAELGWTGMAIPEAYGGTGNTMTDVAVLFEELGKGPVPGPLFSSAILCARIFQEAASESAKQVWLPRIASGERVFALALTEAQYAWSANAIQLKAKNEGRHFALSGTKVFVHDALFATDLLVAARIEGESEVGLFRVDAKAQGVAVRNLDGFLTGLCEVVLDNVQVSGEDRIAAGQGAWRALERAMLAVTPVLCAYKVGGCNQVFDMSVSYARERTQFGQVIGRFQRVQDHIIHIVNYLDSARWTTYEALWKIDSGQDAAASVHVAKSVASESYMRACDFAHEVHAGIGVVREYGLTLHTKMSRSLYHCLGAPNVHRRKLESVLGLVAA